MFISFCKVKMGLKYFCSLLVHFTDILCKKTQQCVSACCLEAYLNDSSNAFTDVKRGELTKNVLTALNSVTCG